MEKPTPRQKEIIDFIVDQQSRGLSPSYREIARHFSFSLTTVADHIRLLKKKGWVTSIPGKARSLQLSPALAESRPTIVTIPVFGSVPAGFTQMKTQETEASICVDIPTLGFRPGAATYGLRVTGDSMIGRHILPGDIAILEYGVTPRPKDVVAALVDQESTLKTYDIEKGRPCLKAENPHYPNLFPTEFLIQGVMRGLYRKQP